jgi:hypothetical protein
LLEIAARLLHPFAQKFSCVHGKIKGGVYIFCWFRITFRSSQTKVGCKFHLIILTIIYKMEIFGFRILWQELTFEFWYRFQKFDWQHQHIIIIILLTIITCTHYQFYLKFESCTASSSMYEFFFYYSLKLMYDHIFLLSYCYILYRILIEFRRRLRLDMHDNQISQIPFLHPRCKHWDFFSHDAWTDIKLKFCFQSSCTLMIYLLKYPSKKLFWHFNQPYILLSKPKCTVNRLQRAKLILRPRRGH